MKFKRRDDGVTVYAQLWNGEPERAHTITNWGMGCIINGFDSTLLIFNPDGTRSTAFFGYWIVEYPEGFFTAYAPKDFTEAFERIKSKSVA